MVYGYVNMEQSMKKTIVISGDILCTQKIQGIPRFAAECIKEMDTNLEVLHPNLDIRVCYPAGKKILLSDLKSIKVIPLERHSRHFRTGDLRKYAKENNAILVNMGPGIILGKNEIVTIHDVRPLEKGFNSCKKAKIQLSLIGTLSRLFDTDVVTVSYFQKKRIEDLLHIRGKHVYVIGNGWEHIAKEKEDNAIFTKFPNIKKGDYFYSLGSMAPHKNYKWIYEVAKRNPSCQFVVAGNVDKNTWGIDEKNMLAENIVYTGYIEDSENISLIRNCRAFIHPSKYEGFGIPPLEALACGKQVIVANSTCLPEIFKGSAVYIDPNSYEIDINELATRKVDDPHLVLEEYTWSKAAQKWLDLFERRSLL